MKRRNIITLKATGLIVLGFWMMAVAEVNVLNAYLSSNIFYEFWSKGFARFCKYNLAFAMVIIFAIGAFFMAAGCTVFYRRFAKTRMHHKIKSKWIAISTKILDRILV